jgi:predicted acetyltransferase
MAEFAAEGRGGLSDHSMIGSEIRGFSEGWQDPAVFARFVRELRADADEATPRPVDRVPSTTLWWSEGDVYFGRLAIRHRLTPSLREIGGHIGYDVRPSARLRGHARAMLSAARPLARTMGIDPVLVTCAAQNIGSRKVIESNGGILEDDRGGVLRFWVPTS